MLNLISAYQKQNVFILSPGVGPPPCFSRKLTNLYSSSFLDLGDMNICRWGADVGSLGPFLYICGGSDDSSRLETVERFDPFANVWVPSVPMSSSRNGVGVTAGSGRIYALGTSCRTPCH